MLNENCNTKNWLDSEIHSFNALIVLSIWPKLGHDTHLPHNFQARSLYTDAG